MARASGTASPRKRMLLWWLRAKRGNNPAALKVELYVRPHSRFRWLLPFGHMLIDLVLVAAWVWHGTTLLTQDKARAAVRTAANVLLVQESDTVEWEPRQMPPPPKFGLILTGTLPAGVISGSLRPKCWWVTRRKVWDPIWLFIHQGVAIPLWFLIGLRIDAGSSPLRRVMLSYLLLRGGFVLLVFGPSSAANIGSGFQFLFWVGMTGYGIVRGIIWTGHIVNRARRRVGRGKQESA